MCLSSSMNAQAEYEHQPVLLLPAVENLIQNKNGIYIDGTYGRGGHSREILRRLSPLARLLIFDRDPDAIMDAKKLKQKDSRVNVFYDNFRYIEESINSQGLNDMVDGILLDVGVSSPQLDNPQRGFSIRHEGPLDMRMDKQHGITALQWLKTSTIVEIRQAFKDFADVRYAGRWARLIQQAVLAKRIKTTKDLALLITDHMPKKFQANMKIHPATQIFQAIRIAVNDEITNLKECLKSTKHILRKGGRLVVLTFHSLEHRMMRKLARGEQEIEYRLPVKLEPKDWKIIELLKYPKILEIESNPRARSARLTVLQKQVN